MTERPGRRRIEHVYRKGFSLASLLLLTAVVAVFLAAICSIWLPSSEGQADPYGLEPPDMDNEVVGVGVTAGLMVGSLVGLAIGANQVRPLPGVFLGTFVGAIAGAASGALLVLPQKTLPIGVGSLVILMFAAVVRRYSRKPPEP